MVYVNPSSSGAVDFAHKQKYEVLHQYDTDSKGISEDDAAQKLYCKQRKVKVNIKNPQYSIDE